MGIEKKDVNELRETIEKCVGQKVLLRGKLSRGKILDIEGTLTSASKDFFLVKLDNSLKETSTYKEVLTNSIELSVCNSENYTSILDIMKENNMKENLI